MPGIVNLYNNMAVHEWKSERKDKASQHIQNALEQAEVLMSKSPEIPVIELDVAIGNCLIICGEKTKTIIPKALSEYIPDSVPSELKWSYELILC